MEHFMQTPHSNAESIEPTGTAEATSVVVDESPRITQDGEERIYSDGEVEIVNS